MKLGSSNVGKSVAEIVIFTEYIAFWYAKTCALRSFEYRVREDSALT